MATIHLNKKAAINSGSSIDEVLFMLIIHNKIDLNRARDSLIDKGWITANRDLLQEDEWRLTNKGIDMLESIIVDSDDKQESEERLEALAKRLKEVFPKGKKDGTNYYWADGMALIVRRLKLFFKKYGNQFTDEQIINAAEKYVQGFNGDYRFMRLLKYFIFKEKVGAAGEVEGDSELISYIENEGQEDSLGNNWTSILK